MGFLDKFISVDKTEEHTCMIFYWYPDTGATPTSVQDELQGMCGFGVGWLQKQEYGTQPNHDGSNGHGWAVFNESWGHVDGSHGAIGAVSPQWIWYGK